MSINEAFGRTNIQGIIALIIIIGGFVFLGFLNPNETTSVSIINLMIMVVSYYFGSSRSTAKKDETIANLIEK